MNTKFGALIATAGALMIGLAATPASAAMTLAVGEEDCDLFSSAGCLFNYEQGDGAIFDDASAYEGAWNGVHLADPAPEVLELGELTQKFEFDGANLSEAINADFAVSYYAVKAGSTQVVLYGLNPAAESFTAFNTRITNRNGGLLGVSHVTVFGTAGGGNEVPEPSTWALMILGFGSAGAMLRSRRHAVARA